MAKFSYMRKESVDECIEELMGEVNKIDFKKEGISKKQLMRALVAEVHLLEEIPRAPFFKEDNREEFLRKLMKVVATPIGKTENQNRKIKKCLASVLEVIYNQGHTGFSAAFTVMNLFLKITGREYVYFYYDQGKIYPQYSSGIFEMAKKLGKEEFLSPIEEDNEKVKNMLMQLRKREIEARDESYYPKDLMVEYQLGGINAVRERQNEARLNFWKRRWGNPEVYFFPHTQPEKPDLDFPMKPAVKLVVEAKNKESSFEDHLRYRNGIRAELKTVEEVNYSSEDNITAFSFYGTGVILEGKFDLKPGDIVLVYLKRTTEVVGLDKVLKINRDGTFERKIIYTAKNEKIDRDYFTFDKVFDERPEKERRNKLLRKILKTIFNKLRDEEAFFLVDEMIRLEDEFSKVATTDSEQIFSVLQETLTEIIRGSREPSRWKGILEEWILEKIESLKKELKL